MWGWQPMVWNLPERGCRAQSCDIGILFSEQALLSFWVFSDRARGASEPRWPMPYAGTQVLAERLWAGEGLPDSTLCPVLVVSLEGAGVVVH